MARSHFPSMTLRSTARAAQLLLTLPLCAAPNWVSAEVSESLLANAPIGLGVSSTVVRPNVAMVLDDSGSMAWDNMPDNGGVNSSEKCYGNSSYNRLAYNPNYVYKPPYKPGGVVPTGNPYKDNKPRYPDATFGVDGAWSDGYASSGARNLGTNKPLEYSVILWDIKYYYSTTTKPSSTCQENINYDAITSSADIQGRGETGTAAALTNYANWYSYYRTRAGMMKAATGEAFSDLNDNYRVGLFFLGKNSDKASNQPIKIDNFSGDQITNWYSRLYASQSDNGTPLRRALSRMGRMYAGKEAEAFGDPVQYSCQQNFTILSTDGYTNNEGSWDLSGRSIPDQDGSAVRPFYDMEKVGDTVSDTAYYYYQTDLRTEALGNCENQVDSSLKKLCDNNVPGSGKDKNSQQHMTTFTIGLGVSGTITYEPNYETAVDTTALQYIDILTGPENWPKVNITSGDCSGTNCPPLIDDLWHAAVNGRGTYYSASDPASVVTGLRAALAGVSARVGSGAAAATSNLEPVAGDNFVYMATYRSVKWDGDLRAFTINPTTGALSDPDKPVWSTQSALDTQVSTATSGDGRTIKYFSTSPRATNNLVDFSYTNLSRDGKGTYFDNACGKSWLSQCASLNADQQVLANAGGNLVDYLRGKDTYEAESGVTNPLFRAREHVLGDPVNAMPVYVKKPPFDYGKVDATYNAFVTANSTRAANVYLATNEGILHAINASNGQERWGYVPSFVMPSMYKLADTNYKHQFYVDGSPIVADVCDTFATDGSGACSSDAKWRTILVGGLNKGGCGYYALDITDPASPKGLWEFTHDQMGYSYSAPVITRRKSDGKWVAIFTSGYYNVPGTCGKTTGDGVGRLFVVDAVTGTLLDTISTGEGTVDAPSNLGKINAWIDNPQMNKADAVYAGDMLGNLWRIDFDNQHPLPSSGKDAFKLAALGQPITTKPSLAEVKGKRIVMVGTGRLLSTPDLTDTTTQSIYGLKDDLAATTGIGDPRSESNAAVIKSRSITESTNAKGQSIRTITGDAIDWTTDKGWYVNLKTAGERLNVEMHIQQNRLTAVTNVPEENACTSGGHSWLYFFDILTGKNMTTATDSAVGYKLSANSTAVGLKTMQLNDGSSVTVVSNSDGTLGIERNPSGTAGTGPVVRRTMWREILD